jgi:hypothetical protein
MRTDGNKHTIQRDKTQCNARFSETCFNIMADDPAFAEALARGLIHFARFAGARRIDVAMIWPDRLREQVRAVGDVFE